MGQENKVPLHRNRKTLPAHITSASSPPSGIQIRVPDPEVSKRPVQPAMAGVLAFLVISPDLLCAFKVVTLPCCFLNKRSSELLMWTQGTLGIAVRLLVNSAK